MSLISRRILTGPDIGIKSVGVTVTSGNPTGSSSADTDLVGATVLGYSPITNQDQMVKMVVVEADGAVTVTLGAAATADNTFNVSVIYG